MIYGIIISDNNGRTILIVENGKKNLIKNLDPNGEKKIDLELIPMFFNSLQRFSTEINMIDFSGFNLQGKNIKINSNTKENITFTCFSSKFLRFDEIQEEFEACILDFINKFRKELKNFVYSGEIKPFRTYNPIIVYKINKCIRNFLKNEERRKKHHEENKISYYKQYFQKIDKKIDLYNIKESGFSIQFLKKELLKALLYEDYEKLEDLVKKIENLVNK